MRFAASRRYSRNALKRQIGSKSCCACVRSSDIVENTLAARINITFDRFAFLRLHLSRLSSVRTTGAPQNHWFGPGADCRAAGIGTREAIRVVWSCHRYHRRRLTHRFWLPHAATTVLFLFASYSTLSEVCVCVCMSLSPPQ